MNGCWVCAGTRKEGSGEIGALCRSSVDPRPPLVSYIPNARECEYQEGCPRQLPSSEPATRSSRLLSLRKGRGQLIRVFRDVLSTAGYGTPDRARGAVCHDFIQPDETVHAIFD